VLFLKCTNCSIELNCWLDWLWLDRIFRLDWFNWLLWLLWLL
jgi:hypothetical protein